MDDEGSVASAGSTPPAQVVGNAFVQQFYQVLHQSPSLVYRFYQESSQLGRPGPDGTVNSVSTMDAINQKILAMNYSEFRAEIKTVDAQDSLSGGVIVLVTGYLTGKDEVKRDFTQSFFLAPQDKGYFVLNDIFRYTEKADHQLENLDLPNGTSVPISPEEDSPFSLEQVVEQTSVPITEEEEVNDEEVCNPSDNEEASAVVEEEVPVEEVINEVPSGNQQVVANLVAVTSVQEEAPKKSYASIVKLMKENPAPLSVPKPAARPAPPRLERQYVPSPGLAPAPEIPAAASSIVSESSIQEEEADGYSVYIKGLPLNATAAQLEEEFKKFGTIKPDGIQVRSNKLQGFCFGFVEFEVPGAVQSAIEASPVTIGGRQAFVEEKRTTGSRGNQ
ncbi:ras GTPase-activating protein-binding protein 1-like [Iris pallida]|uniref:Ras GTPase-activating protein-binding protein 1-like n=1 Tax=Iris pallida TaxID=29817 RepID=A0AAX6EV33_IRIPA|nr:ras GTPase-activating protein-binding protein 1-like [Iris pallida]KAJ6837171.1 ras GTPase-activating protein-binding protein 1-like [Iris pallida]